MLSYTLDGLSITTIQFQGERDSRGPGDFSGTGAAKFDDDGDDQDDDEEEESSKRPGKRKVAPAKLGMPPDMPAPNTVRSIFPASLLKG